MNRKEVQGSADQPCTRFEPFLILAAAGDELEAPEKAELTEHLAGCPSCSAALDRERALVALLAGDCVEPDAGLLASCRAGLEDALDRDEERGWFFRKLALVVPEGWLSPRPAWSAAILILTGFTIGAFGPRLLQQRPVAGPEPSVASHSAAPAQPPAKVAEADSVPSPDSPLSTLDLHNADVAGISVMPSADEDVPQVQVRLRARQPVTFEGTVNNNDVERVLLYVLQHSRRFDPDVRLNAVDLLCARKNDPEVRSTLCQSVRSDGNAAVRLKALEALNGSEPQAMVRETLLDALVDDQNPGVRVEAINAIREMAAKGQCPPQGRVMSVLRDRMEKDPNAYIRLQSAAAIRDIGPRQKF